MRAGLNVVLALAGTPIMLGMTTPDKGARFGQICSGIETVKFGAQPPQRAIYTIALSIDLTAKRYCYATCSRGQTYTIADSEASPVKLADFDAAGQHRHMLLDRGTARLTDDQRMVMGPMLVVRHAEATCKPAPFKEPPAI
jgi:hypothetical protein